MPAATRRAPERRGARPAAPRSDETASNVLTVASATNTTNATTTHSTFNPDARPPRYLAPSSLPFRATDPLIAFLPLYFLLISMLDHLRLPPPRLRPSCLLPGLALPENAGVMARGQRAAVIRKYSDAKRAVPSSAPL